MRRAGERSAEGLALIMRCFSQHLSPACVPQDLKLSRGRKDPRIEALITRAFSQAIKILALLLLLFVFFESSYLLDAKYKTATLRMYTRESENNMQKLNRKGTFYEKTVKPKAVCHCKKRV